MSIASSHKLILYVQQKRWHSVRARRGAIFGHDEALGRSTDAQVREYNTKVLGRQSLTVFGRPPSLRQVRRVRPEVVLELDDT